MPASSSGTRAAGPAKPAAPPKLPANAQQARAAASAVRGTRGVPKSGSYEDVPRNFLSGMDRPLYAPSYAAGGGGGRSRGREQTRQPKPPPLPYQLLASAKGSSASVSMSGSVFETGPASHAAAASPAPTHVPIPAAIPLHAAQSSNSRLDKVKPLSLQQALRTAHNGGKGEGVDHRCVPCMSCPACPILQVMSCISVCIYTLYISAFTIVLLIWVLTSTFPPGHPRSNARLALVGCNVTHISTQPVPSCHALQALYLRYVWCDSF